MLKFDKFLQDKLYLSEEILNKSLRKIPYFHLISWCVNLMEKYSFHIDSGKSPEIMRKLYLSTKFPHQEVK